MNIATFAFFRNPPVSLRAHQIGGGINARPVRYRRDRDISTAVDLLQAIEDRLLEAGDLAGAERVAVARNRVADLALGTKGGR